MLHMQIEREVMLGQYQSKYVHERVSVYSSMLYFTRHGHAGPVFCSPAIPSSEWLIKQITNSLVSHFRYNVTTYLETISQFGFLQIDGQPAI